MARKPKTALPPSAPSTEEETVRLDVRAFRETEKLPVLTESEMETTLIINPSASAGTQMMQVIPESQMETTVIINPSASAGTQMMQVVPESQLETTVILKPSASAGTQMMQVVPECQMETTVIINPSASAGTQMMQVVPESQLEVTQILQANAYAETPIRAAGSEPKTEANPLPKPSSTDVTVAIPVVSSVSESAVSTLAAMPEPQLMPENSTATLAMNSHDIPKHPMPELRPLDAEVTPSAVVFAPASSFDSNGEEPSSQRGLWLAVGAATVFLALGIWYVADRKTAEVPPAEEAAAPATIPAPVPPGYQDILKQAQAGDVAAMRNLGAVYTYGLGVPVHRQEGLRWYKKAAEAGSAVAAEEAKALENPSQR